MLRTAVRTLTLAAALAPAALSLGAVQTASAEPRIKDLYEGFNLIGPAAAISPEEFVSCLDGKWSVIWYYSASESTWRWHFPEGDGPGQVPAFINDPSGNGIGTIPGGRGVAVYVTEDIPGATIPTRPGEGCLTT